MWMNRVDWREWVEMAGYVWLGWWACLVMALALWRMGLDRFDPLDQVLRWGVRVGLWCMGVGVALAALLSVWPR